MTGSSFDYTYWESGILRIFDAAPLCGFTWDKRIVRSLIGAGEWGLALDEMAAAYLSNAKPIPNDILNLFEELATSMKMVPGDEYEAVAELLALPRQP
jgi:hypothetical protein